MVLTAPTSTVYDPNSDLSTRNNPRSKVKQVVKQRTGSIQPLFDLINDITLYLCLLAATVNGIASVASISFLLLFGVVVLFVTTSNCITSMDGSDMHITPSGALSTPSEYYSKTDTLINRIASSIFLVPTASSSTVYHSQAQQAMLAAIDTIRVVSFGSYYNEKKLDNSADIHIWYHKAFASDGRNIWLTPIQPTFTATDIIRGWVCTRITTTSNHIMSMDSSDRHFTPSGALSTSSEYYFEPDILINQSSIFLLPTASTSTVYHSQTQQPMFAATAIIRVASFGSYYNEDRLDNSADIHIWYHKTFASHGRNVWLSPIQPMLAATDIIRGWDRICITHSCGIDLCKVNGIASIAFIPFLVLVILFGSYYHEESVDRIRFGTTHLILSGMNIIRYMELLKHIISDIVWPVTMNICVVLYHVCLYIISSFSKEKSKETKIIFLYDIHTFEAQPIHILVLLSMRHSPCVLFVCFW
eukprot:204104_1